MQTGCFLNCAPLTPHHPDGFLIAVVGVLVFMSITLVLGAICRHGQELVEEDAQDNARRDQWEQAFREWRGH